LGVERHDVEVVGIAGDDAPNEISRPGERSFGVNDGRTTEEVIARGSHLGRGGAKHPNRREWAVIVEADAPRIEQHASKVSGMIDVKMCEEDGL
jgi:hypothetical protein